MGALIMALCSRHKEVFWWSEDDDEFNLYNRMQDWVTKGETFTILEYIPDDDNYHWDGDVSKRAMWWDKQLAEQGYDIDVER